MFYNLQKASDRKRFRRDRQEELRAIENGTWPRDTSDLLRWGSAGPETTAANCRADLAYLDDVEKRIANGDPIGWEV